MKIISFQISESIDLRRFKREYTGEPIYNNSFELFYSDDQKRHLYILGYGVVVFAGYDDMKMSEFMLIIESYCRNQLKEKYREELVIVDNAEKDAFTYNEIFVSKLDVQVLRIIMLNVGQSVALDYYLQTGSDLLEKTNRLTEQLEKNGAINISGKNLLRFIGKTMNVKNSIVDNLFIIDSPEAVWDNEYLAKIDKGLKETFDLKIRYRDVDEQLKIVKENLDLFIEIFNTRRSNYLEIIVIILILVEVVYMVIEKLF